MLPIVVAFIWSAITFVGGFLVITSKALWNTAHIPLSKRFDKQLTIGALMLLAGVIVALLFFAKFMGV